MNYIYLMKGIDLTSQEVSGMNASTDEAHSMGQWVKVFSRQAQ